jgi:hypothetical protein
MWSVIRTVLAVLNVLGALTFCALAAMDYGKRQTWSYAVVLHDIAIDGLPVDDKVVNGENEKVAELLGERGIKDVFGNVPSPIATQKAEVDRVKAKLDGSIGASSDKRAQLVVLARILTPMAGSEAQRERLIAIQNYLSDSKVADRLKADLTRTAEAGLRLKNEPNKPFAAAFAEQVQALRGPSRKPFEEAMVAEQGKPSPKKPDELFEDSLEQMHQKLQAAYDDAFKAIDKPSPDSKDSTYAERKMIIASLLLNLIESAHAIEENKDTTATPVQGNDAAFSRYLTVVGLDAGVQAIRRRSYVLVQMANDLRLETERDRNGFVNEHQKLFAQLQQSAEKQAKLTEALDRQKDLLAKREALVNRRKQDITVFDAELAKLSKEAADRLAEVQSMSEELYKVRIATRNASEENQKYEQKIRTLEQGR